MNILTKRHPGLIHICSNCGALYQFHNGDIYAGIVYCPLCRTGDKIDYDKDYDGLVKEEKK